jgi:hypothetical protein
VALDARRRGILHGVNKTWRSTTRLLVALTSALVLASVPTADVLAFSIHEHVADQGQGRDVAGPDSPQGSASHHCELSASSAELVHMVELPKPVRLGLEPIPDLAAARRHRPFVPLTPPRA